jgi:hypothetical protein
MKNIYTIKIAMLSILMLSLLCTDLMASSHREAPLISNDPLADNVDLYAFRSPDNPDMITLIATYVPMQLPHGGPNYYSFGENIRYEIHIDNNTATPGDDITYRFTFRHENEDPSTFFNIRLGQQNLKATYTLEKSIDGGLTFIPIILNGVVPPNNIGQRSIESTVGLGTTYDNLFQNAVTTSLTGETVFAGPTDDPFFVDLGGIFDLGNAPRQAGKPVDALACLNVSTIAIQVPISSLLKLGAPIQPTSILDPDYVIGVWASASRPAIRTLSNSSDPDYSGDWVQVSRLGMPLTNEAVIPVGSKDFWNAISPYDEISETTLDEFFYNPELALYMDDDQFGGAVPAFGPLRIQEKSLGAFDFTNGGDGLFGLKGDPVLDGTALDDDVFGTLLLPAPGKPRSVDLWPTFHTGVPNVIPYQLATGKEGNPLAAGKPFINNFLPNGGDMLRLNMAVPPTPRDSDFFSSLGLVQAAAIGLTVAPFNETTDLEFIPNMDGFPNGRRLEDDVTRIELQAVAGVVLAAVGLWYDDFDPASGGSPVTQDLLNVLSYTTGVEQNDEAFTSSFPYLPLPHSGTSDCSGAIYEGDPSEAATVENSFYVSSNTQGRVGAFNINSDMSIDFTTFVNNGADADGIYYDELNDLLYQLNRTTNRIDLYAAVNTNLDLGIVPELITSSSSDFINGREIAVSGNKLVVAQDANDANGQVNQFVVYDITPTEITLSRIYTSEINLWGIHLDGNTLYAVEDNSSNLAVYNNFFSNSSGIVSADASIEIASMIRTHGLTFDRNTNTMILTDVAEASSAADGAIVVVENFTEVIGDNLISDDEQTRLEGLNTSLGNPVDVAYNVDGDIILVAERASQGGVILGFDYPMTGGDIAPRYSQLFTGASAIYLGGTTEEFTLNSIGDLFISSNTSNLIGVADVLEDRNLEISTFTNVAADADGIFYDSDADVLYQINRTDNVINAYSDVMTSLAAGMTPAITATSSSDFINGRELAIAGDRMVVAQDANDANGQLNRLYVYQFSPTSIVLKKTYDVDINLWGIHADVNTLYAIVDNSDELAVYQNFFENLDGTITATRVIQIDEMVRTHGLTYDSELDLMLLTDVGDAANDLDGAIHIIPEFTSASLDNQISTVEQTRIAGDITSLGNPVDIAYKQDIDAIYVAERANGGGRILGFDNGSIGGNITPFYNEEFAGASAVFIEDVVTEDNPTTSTNDFAIETINLEVFPNPTADYIEINLDRNLVERDMELSVYSLEGKKLKSQILSRSSTVIELNSLESGVYLIEVLSSTKRMVAKVLKM